MTDFRKHEFTELAVVARIAHAISKVDKIRRDSENTGHHCAYRQAADALCDILKISLEDLGEISKNYQTAQLREIDRLRDENEKLKAQSIPSKGGTARAEVLSPERRSEIAKQAAGVRWATQGIANRHVE